ncbi:hypothetical protein [Gallibacterium anatis]|uniref:Uncharacterized protein n=1 Tax=Gallibacterium anatis 4895 TaxID=1396510 RepID=A0A0A3AHQ0_9PAST|nr:hypothetical protein [Gallibacterium anatis]KGQ61069.1 hypothetical protein IO48_08205 [Gallibacterium anatis 4895]
MPNWCVGDLKIRGKVENIAQFLTECIDDCNVQVNGCGDLEIENIGGQLIKNIGRVYCDNGRNETIEGYGSAECLVVIIPIMVAWCLDPSDIAEVSKRFNVDFRFYGFEKGMGFNQVLEVIKGKITLNKYIEFFDYVWECPLPMLGG